MSEKLMDLKVVVQVTPPPGLTLAEELEVCGQFAYRAQCVAEFKHGDDVIQVWYVNFTHAPNDGWRATRNGMPIPRDNHRWGQFVEP